MFRNLIMFNIRIQKKEGMLKGHITYSNYLTNHVARHLTSPAEPNISQKKLEWRTHPLKPS